MKTQIDLKSAICGLAVGVLAVLAIGAGTGTFSNQTGRFQLVSTQNVALLIDTQTGKVWTKCWTSTGEFTTDEDFFKPKLVEPIVPGAR